uniref:Claudin 34 n=1 Tax=Podarcis muralis TaxID=64176 RepID=A0A670K0S1_PODMU
KHSSLCHQLCAFLIDIVAWIMCIASTAVVNWRVWSVENIKGIGSGNIWIGIWQVCFWKDPSNDGNSFWHCEDLNEQHPSLPREIFIAQDLMALASIMNSAALGLISFALYNVFEPRKHKNFVLTFFRLAAFLNLVAGILVLISVVWNTSAVLHNGKIVFPEDFELPQIPSEQHIGPSIYLGYIAAGFQLLRSGKLSDPDPGRSFHTRMDLRGSGSDSFVLGLQMGFDVLQVRRPLFYD